MKNRIFLMGLAVLLLTGSFLFANGGGEKTEEKVVSGPYTGEPEPMVLPLVDEPTTLEYWCEIDAKKIGVHTQDYNDLLQYQLFEENTGVHIDFKHPPAGQGSEQFNLLVVSGNRPDMMFRGGWNTDIAGGPQKLMDDGVFLDLIDYIPRYAPNLWGFLNEDDPINAKIKKDIMTDNGSIYVFPYIRYKQNIRNYSGYMARGDWLSKAGITPPQTIPEWDAALKYVKENDVNGNGDPNDEIPLTCRTITDDQTIYAFAGAWDLYPYAFVDKTDKIVYGAVQKAYKDYLLKMAEWAKKGYIDPDFSSLSIQQKQARIMDNKVAFFNDGLGMGMDVYVMGLGGDSSKVIPLNYPTALGHSDHPLYFYGDNAEFSGAGTAISGSSDNPVLAAKWLDYAYSAEGSEIVNFGQEGKTFNWINGFPQLVDDIYKNPDMSVSVALGRYCLGASWGPFIHDARVRDQRMLKWPEQVDAGKMWAEADLTGMIPFISFNAEESSEVADLQNEIKTYTDEMTLKFIMGQADINKDFDQFVATLNKMDVKRLVELYEAAYKRYKVR